MHIQHNSSQLSSICIWGWKARDRVFGKVNEVLPYSKLKIKLYKDLVSYLDN